MCGRKIGHWKMRWTSPRRRSSIFWRVFPYRFCPKERAREKRKGCSFTGARRANHQKLSSPVAKNFSLSSVPKSSLQASPSNPERGAYRDRHGRGVGCGGRGSVGRADVFAGRSPVSEQQRADEQRFNASAKIRRAAHGPSKSLAEVAADGEVVWSWHPLLMLSLAEIKSAQPGLD